MCDNMQCVNFPNCLSHLQNNVQSLVTIKHYMTGIYVILPLIHVDRCGYDCITILENAKNNVTPLSEIF